MATASIARAALWTWRRLAGHPAVLVAVAVAHHDLLQRPLETAKRSDAGEASPHDRPTQQRIEDRGGADQIVDGLEERHDGKRADEARFEQTSFPREHEHREQVRDGSRHAHDEASEAIGSVRATVGAHNMERVEDELRLRGRRGRRKAPTVIAFELPVEPGEPLRFVPRGVVRPVLRGAEQAVERELVDAAVLPDVEGDEMEAERSDVAEDRCDVVIGETIRRGSSAGPP